MTIFSCKLFHLIIPIKLLYISPFLYLYYNATFYPFQQLFTLYFILKYIFDTNAIALTTACIYAPMHILYTVHDISDTEHPILINCASPLQLTNVAHKDANTGNISSMFFAVNNGAKVTKSNI